MFQKIYETYRVRVFDYIAGKVKDRDDTCDIMQNVFFHLWLHKESLGINTENIIFKTCNQEISNFFALKKKQPSISNSQDIEIPDESADQLKEQYDKEEQLNTIQINIELLPAPRKQILTMNKLEGISQEKIADRLNLSKKAVKKQISKAILFLRESAK